MDEKLAFLQKIKRDPEIDAILEYRKQHGRAMICGAFKVEVERACSEIPVQRGESWASTLVREVTIFWPAGLTDEKIRSMLTAGLVEQHSESPHRYEHDENAPLSGRIAALIGASDCLFAASIASRFERLVVFEPMEQWHDPIEKTMRGLGVDYELVPKFVGERDTTATVRLDTVFSGSESDVSLIQADVEGAEINVLLGAESVIACNNVKASICCYHTQHQQGEVVDFFAARDYQTQISKGYLDPMTAKKLQYPFLRRGVVYASPRI